MFSADDTLVTLPTSPRLPVLLVEFAFRQLQQPIRPLHVEQLGAKRLWHYHPRGQYLGA